MNYGSLKTTYSCITYLHNRLTSDSTPLKPVSKEIEITKHGAYTKVIRLHRPVVTAFSKIKE